MYLDMGFDNIYELKRIRCLTCIQPITVHLLVFLNYHAE